MTGHDEFMRTIRDRPGEDAPRLVYADWLEENGYGLYAEFIRLHIKAASESESGAQSRLLASRLLEVWEQRENWGFLPPGWKKLRLESYRRGLLWSWNGPVSLFLRHAHVLWDYGPVVELCVEGTDGMLCKLAQCEYLSRLHSLTIRPSKILETVSEPL